MPPVSACASRFALAFVGATDPHLTDAVKQLSETYGDGWVDEWLRTKGLDLNDYEYEVAKNFNETLSLTGRPLIRISSSSFMEYPHGPCAAKFGALGIFIGVAGLFIGLGRCVITYIGEPVEKLVPMVYEQDKAGNYVSLTRADRCRQPRSTTIAPLYGTLSITSERLRQMVNYSVSLLRTYAFFVPG
ncbi:VirB8 family type IV secretion system protein [Klebsiella quasipneumoniae]|uniref:hypothetical protein n=1 Tax=Klebsiella quasipneumoniae TaxID=1463165 RepID=UPI003890E0DA